MLIDMQTNEKPKYLTMDIAGKFVYSNTFGTIIDNRVFLNYKSGTESFPFDQINTASFLHRRNYFFAVGSILAVALTPMYFANAITVIIIILFFMILGIANWIGHHNIIVRVGGQKKNPLKVEMARTKDGKQFVEALKKSIVKQSKISLILEFFL